MTEETKNQPKRTKIWSTRIDLLKSFIEDNNLTLTQAGNELGMSSTGLSGYLTDGKMPFTVELAVKYLNEQRKDPDGVKHYMMTVCGEQLSVVLLEPLEEMVLGGNRFKLVPI